MRWRRRTGWLVAGLAVVSGAMGSGAVAAAEESPFTDRVGTLPLSQELDSRGSLGGITVDRLGFLYVANFRDKVWKISPEGHVELLSDALYGASGNAVDARGDLYQANFLGNTISRISRSGEVTTFAAGDLAGPVGIAVGDDGRLLVCNCRGNRLSEVSPDGEVTTFAESELFACPNGITFGPDGPGGDLFVTNFNHLDILRITPDGEVSRFATVPGGAGNAHIAFTRGFFYVTKIVAQRVVKVSVEGEVFPVAGTGQPGHDDGPALEATFHRPNGIAVAPQGDLLYVNTLVGEPAKPQPSTITVRTVDLLGLAEVLEEALAEGGLERVEERYRQYKADPLRGRDDTAAEVIALGYRLLTGRQVAEAVALFRLNAESYPERPAPQFHLGEALRYAGRTEEAAAQYRRVLELDPDHPQAAARLAQLSAGG